MDNDQLKIIAINRTSGEVYASNIIDTLYFDDFFISYSIDHSPHTIPLGSLGDIGYTEVNLSGRPLELIVTSDEVYVQSFGWYEVSVIVNNPVYIISKLTKDLSACTTIDLIGINPVPDLGGAHPYEDNSKLHYNQASNLLCLVYTDRSYEEDVDYAFAEHKADAYLRSYTSGYRLANETLTYMDEISISLNPNPATNLLQVETETEANYKIIFQSITGAEIFSESFSSSMQIDVAKWARGIYLVQVFANGEITTPEKIILQ